MALVIKKIEKEDLNSKKLALEIRKKVFVDEQKVPIEEEIDDFEEESCHFLAYYNDLACGTARWRQTPQGIKLERFAVLADYRGLNVGKHICKAIIEDIQKEFSMPIPLVYLHAQQTAIGFYEKLHFTPLGDIFEECAIKHQKMIQQL